MSASVPFSTVAPPSVSPRLPADAGAGSRTATIDTPWSTGVRWAMSLLLVAGDLLGLVLVAGGTWMILTHAPLPGAAIEPDAAATGLVGGVLAMLAAYVITGLYRHPLVHPATEMQRLGTVTAGMGGAASVVLGLTTAPVWVGGLALGAALVGACVVPVTRGLTRILAARIPGWGIPTVVLGTDALGTRVVDTLRRWPEIGLRPMARLTNEPVSDAAASDSDVPLVGRVHDAPHLAQTSDVPYAIVALPELPHAERARRVATYSKFFDHVFVVADGDDWPALWVADTSKGLFAYDIRHYALQPTARFVKRTLDVVGATCALLVLAPVFLVIGALIKLSDPGPVFFRQHRMGRDGRVFTVLKFRTMYTDAHQKLQAILNRDPVRRREYERFHKLQDDPRVTSIGRVLRSSSLDELPQLLNVLRGDMSLVGPRAYMPGELPKMNGLSRAVLQTPPGITGLWQVSGRNRLSFDERVNLDVHYIQNWSPWLDLYLLVRTIPVVLTGDGAC